MPEIPSLESGGTGAGTLEARPGSQECQSPALLPATSPESPMSLRWDALLLTALAHELRERLRGARLRAISPEFEARRLTLFFREGTLTVRLHPDEAAVLWLPPSEPPADARPLAARLRDVEAPADDRIIVFSFLRVRGSPTQADLVLEWLTNQHNAMVTEGPQRIVRLVFRTREGERPVRQGQPYELPPLSERLGSSVDDEVSLDFWMERLLPLEPKERRSELLRSFAWTSPINTRPLLGAALSPDAGPEATRAALEAGWNLWSKLAAIARGETKAHPVLLETPKGLQPYPVPLPGVDRAESAADRRVADGADVDRPSPDHPGLLELIAEAVAQDASASSPSEVLLPAALVARLERHVENLRRRVARLEQEEADLPDPLALRQTGDLLLARLADIPEGASEVQLQDFAGGYVTVELNPRLAPHENARSWYDQAARAARAAERLPRLKAEARDVWQRASALLEQAHEGTVTADVIDAAIPPDVEGPGAGRDSEEGVGLPYRRYRSSGGLEIRVGRGARRNDDLTFRHSAPNDIWLHARHAQGAHVILRWNRDEKPPERDLHEAGALAALYSKARTSASVPVDWTRRKYVRKPRKAAPGAVLPDRVQTVFVTPDEQLEARLREA